MGSMRRRTWCVRGVARACANRPCSGSDGTRRPHPAAGRGSRLPLRASVRLTALFSLSSVSSKVSYYSLGGLYDRNVITSSGGWKSKQKVQQGRSLPGAGGRVCSSTPLPSVRGRADHLGRSWACGSITPTSVCILRCHLPGTCLCPAL